MSTHPRISVVIPCRNMGKYVGAAIESVLAQTVAVQEILVIDDGSNDDTSEVLRRYSASIKALRGPGKGSAVARNLGILESQGDHIAFLDADDLWMPNKIERQIAALDVDHGFVFSDFYREDDPQAPGAPMLAGYSAVAEGWVFSNLLRENFVSTPTALVRKQVLANAGIFKPALIGGQDFDLWLRIAKQTQFAWVREPLVFMRKHAGNISSSAPYPYYHARVWEEILREHGPREPDDVAYIKQRYATSLYNAGRHAIRQMDEAMARKHLRLAWRHGHRAPSTALWLAVAHLPAGVRNSMLRAKRAVASGAH